MEKQLQIGLEESPPETPIEIEEQPTASPATKLAPVQLKRQQVQAALAVAPPNLVRPGTINDIVKFKRLFQLGLTHEEIAEFFGVSREMVTMRVKKLGLERIKYSPTEFKHNMETELLGRMQKILNSMSDDKVERASLSQLIMAFGIMFDKMRLMRGESTQNVAALNVHQLDPTALESIRAIIGEQTAKKLAAAKKDYNTLEQREKRA